MVTSIVLSPDQEAALQVVIDCILRGDHTTMLAGAAGTGKSTVTEEVIRRITELGIPTIQCAPTGKAALRLMETTQRPAVTVHRIAYQRAHEDDDGNLWFSKREEGSLGSGSLATFSAMSEGFGEEAAKKMRDMMELMRSGTKRILLIIDEASMVSRYLREDLEHALNENIQILAIGDHCQLRPVGGPPGYLLEEAEAKLEKVHRQAEGSPLLMLATRVREDQRHITPFLVAEYGLKSRKWNAYEVADRMSEVVKQDHDCVCLVSRNKSRLWLNDEIRKRLGYPEMRAGPQIGEKVICLQNNYSIPCFNGEIGVVLKEGEHRFDLKTEHLTLRRFEINFGTVVRSAYICLEAWYGRQCEAGDAGKISKAMRAELKGNGYGVLSKRLTGFAPASAITVHKSQGSQWPRGIFVMDTGWMGRNSRWRAEYTGATRFQLDDVAFVPSD